LWRGAINHGTQQTRGAVHSHKRTCDTVTSLSGDNRRFPVFSSIELVSWKCRYLYLIIIIHSGDVVFLDVMSRGSC
jgi:hypothetical protein